MNNKSVAYSLISLILGTIVVTLSTTNSVRATDSNQMQSSPSGTTSSASKDRETTEVDKTFIKLMVPHHQALIDMSNMALTKGKNPAVKQLAQKMIQEQTKDVNNMKSWYQQWYGKQVPTTSMMTSTPEGVGQEGKSKEDMEITMQQQDKMMQSMMQSINRAPNFDQAYLTQMISHHQLGIIMSEFAASNGRHREITKLGADDVKTQNEEIGQMQQMLAQGTN